MLVMCSSSVSPQNYWSADSLVGHNTTRVLEPVEGASPQSVASVLIAWLQRSGRSIR